MMIRRSLRFVESFGAGVLAAGADLFCDTSTVIGFETFDSGVVAGAAADGRTAVADGALGGEAEGGHII